MNYLLRILLALDAFVQATFRFGLPGVTISSRAGTAKAHQHRWGCLLCDFLDSRIGAALGFGKDPVTGSGHCEAAIIHDRARARAVLHELEGY